MNNTLLRLENISKTYSVKKGFWGQSQKLLAVDNISLTLNKGESLGLVGESGCGKSTLGRVACGLEAPDSGKVLFEDKSLPLAGSCNWATGQIQMIFQDPGSSLDPRMTIRESIAEPLLVREKSNPELCYEKVEQLLTIVGLEGLGNRYPHQFSGGQRQRVACARAIITNPSLIICDEPVSALDTSVQAQILNLLKDMQDNFLPSYLFISHDLSVVGFMCPRINVMYLGQIVEKATRDELFENPAHPYSLALFEAMPKGEKVWQKGKGLDQIPPYMPGELPSPLNPPSGCRFHPRCFQAREICSKEEPALKKIGENWFVKCHYPLSKNSAKPI